MTSLNLVEASIEELQAALTAGTLTSVELVAHYLKRVVAYDHHGPSLNSIPILNQDVFDEAAASDDRRASGCSVRLLEGIPYTVKDSYKVRGMTAACGSPAFADLVANEDAFTVDAIRNAGGVLIGRTNMPPMAYGGMQRGIYGRAESPYNSRYLAAAFWSGSSNGSAVATAASLSAFGMGEETVSSGRSPASNNALVAYTPSRGWLSIRGNWPLYPTCDVVVPHTRTMSDMLKLLQVIAVEDPITLGDFWRDQPFTKLERPWSHGPAQFSEIEKHVSLQGLRIAVPHMYIGGPVPAGIRPVTTSPEVVELWEESRKHLESLGAEIVIVPDFPVVTAYENPELLPEGAPRLPPNWHASERGPIIAHAWNDFLKQNQDTKIPNIASVDPLNIYPDSLRTGAELTVLDRSNAIRFRQLEEYAAQGSLYRTKYLEAAVASLEGLRKCLLDDWLASIGCQCVAFPAAGDVGFADADISEASAAHSWENGVYYSNGNRALRHLGVPTVSIPMGTMEEKKMPVNLTFAGAAYEDANLLRYGNAYEQKTKKRMAPPLTPALDSDIIAPSCLDKTKRLPRPTLKVHECLTAPISDETHSVLRLAIAGTIIATNDNTPQLEVEVDGRIVQQQDIHLALSGKTASGEFTFEFNVIQDIQKPVDRDVRSRTRAAVARDSTMVVLLARSGPHGRPSGCLRML